MTNAYVFGGLGSANAVDHSLPSLPNVTNYYDQIDYIICTSGGTDYTTILIYDKNYAEQYQADDEHIPIIYVGGSSSGNPWYNRQSTITRTKYAISRAQLDQGILRTYYLDSKTWKTSSGLAANGVYIAYHY